jgi:hypothetical protein
MKDQEESVIDKALDPYAVYPAGCVIAGSARRSGSPGRHRQRRTRPPASTRKIKDVRVPDRLHAFA